ncbi:YeiH family protein [Bacillus massilinigeriensis]|uniref:YeiH family protein n=1 Tax=Bacillus massilionigeriensis TaxID=1805475 RepID=UPI00096AE9FB|nr:putative sulfate exporter family transporter [Bacillus massilionigeriensis]
MMMWLYGVGFTFVIAAIGYLISKVPVLISIGPMACAIFLAILYRQLFDYPFHIRTGIQFSSKHLLRFAIVLYGLKLNIDVIIHQGLGLLIRDTMVIVFAILAMIMLGRRLKASPSITFLLGVGTGVCGAAAIAAISSILKSNEEDTAISVGIIALVGTVFSVTYTIIWPFLPISSVEYGMWSGMSLHEIAHVALAGAVAGQEGLAMALVAKLGRVLLLIPLSLILIYWMKRSNTADTKEARIEFPWFLIGFILMSVFGSFVLGKAILVSQEVIDKVSMVTSFFMSSAMVGLGLNISFSHLRKKALRPLTTILIVSLALSIITFFII